VPFSGVGPCPISPAGSLPSAQALVAVPAAFDLVPRGEPRALVVDPGGDVGHDPGTLQVAHQHVPATRVEDEPWCQGLAGELGEQGAEGASRDDLVVLAIEHQSGWACAGCGALATFS